jgi:hypothetical protein
MTELIVNGTFDVDASGWSGSSGVTPIAVDGELEVKRNVDGVAIVYQAVATDIGAKYRLSAKIIPGTAPLRQVSAGTSGGSGAISGSQLFATGSTVFTATVSTTFIRAHTSNSATAGQYARFDDISLTPVPPRVPARSSYFLT